MNKPKVTNKITKFFPETQETVTVEISDTPEGFFWRMSIFSENRLPFICYWSAYYSGITTTKSRLKPHYSYLYLTDYWLSVLPTETILLVKE
jgi:hypothetical protein